VHEDPFDQAAELNPHVHVREGLNFPVGGKNVRDGLAVVFANGTCGATDFRSDIRIPIPAASNIGMSHSVAFFNKSPLPQYRMAR